MTVSWGLKRFHETRQLHYLTFSCFKRRPNFHTVESCTTFESALERVRQKYLLCVYGYVVMPGGERAVRDPWRMAAAYLSDAGEDSNLLRQRVPSADGPPPGTTQWTWG